MLYNPTWRKPDDIFSTESLIRWLTLRDPRHMYDYQSCKYCLIAQYLIDNGYNHVNVTPRHYTSGTDWMWNKPHPLPDGWAYIAIGDGSKGWTFGEALARAKRVLAQEKEKVTA
jgi:hypothetical protein